MIQRNASDLLGSIHSMSWDLAHWRNIMMLVTANSHHGIDANFPVPYFLTFDQAFATLLRQLQLRGSFFLPVAHVILLFLTVEACNHFQMYWKMRNTC